MQKSRLMLGGAVLAVALSLGAPALAQDIDFGDDASTWANDGQCDDPRFEGAGAAIVRSPVDELHDATDCRTAFEAGEITLVGASDATEPATPETPAVAGAETDIDFGDDSGVWANDNECDDPRFGGSLDSHVLADATDCRTAYEAGEVTYTPDTNIPTATAPEGAIDFGSDIGSFANDGECDDPRFGGTLTSHEMADATDCRAAYEAGDVTYTPPTDPQVADAPGDIDFGDDSGVWANDGECDDPRFGGTLDDHVMADATDCRAAYEAGDVTYTPPADPQAAIPVGDIDFGDDSGNWANDDECDDPRFIGTGVGVALDDHLMADATDCRTAYEAGTVTLATEGNDGTTINFGDDSGNYANDDECDDPRFTGPGVGAALDDHLMADATDCRTAYEAGTVTLASEDAGFSINFGDDSSTLAYDGVCNDPRFQGRGGAPTLFDADLMADATDCRAAYDAGTVTYTP